MKKEQRARVNRALDSIIKSSTGNLLVLLHYLAEASMLGVDYAKRLIDGAMVANGAATAKSPMIVQLKDFYGAINKAAYIFDDFIESTISEATYGANEGDNKVKSYDNFHFASSGLFYFMMLIYDRCYHNPENWDAIERYLLSLPSSEVFSGDAISYFGFKESQKENR